MSLSQLAPMLVLPAVYQFAKTIDFEDEENLLYARLAFGTVQALCFAVIFYLRSLVVASTNTDKIQVPLSPLQIKEDGPTTEVITVAEYDYREWRSLLNQQVTSIAILLGLHLYFGYMIPLVSQLIMAPWKLYGNKLLKVYLRGVTGPQAKRPFKADEGPFDKLKEQLNKLKEETGGGKKHKKKVKKRPPHAL